MALCMSAFSFVGSSAPPTSSIESSRSGNLGGCPQLAQDCKFECLTIDRKGCLKCSCTESSSDLTGGQTDGSGSANLAGCPPLPKDCNHDFLAVGDNGCIICTCRGHSNGQPSANTSQASVSGPASNGNGCPIFPNNCRQECVYLDSNFCPVCDCGSAASGKSGSNGCPPFPTNCRSDCVSVDSAGCPLCSCTVDSNSSSSSLQPGSNNPASPGNINNCPAFSSSCTAECTTVDVNGCPICLCAVTPAPSGSFPSTKTNLSTGGGSDKECPPLIQNCDQSCLSLDRYGCIVCKENCNSGSTGGNSKCPKFDSANCPASCSSFNAYGCFLCTCNGSVTTTSRSVTVCPVLDTTQCNPSCLKLDRNGCVSCDCAGNTGITSILTTAKLPALPQHNKTETSATAGQSGTGTGSLIGIGCPTFDVSCPAGCASVDDKGCLLCSCQATTKASGSQTTSVPGNMNNCPDFDISCPSGCAKIDANGCLACSCSASLQGQGSRSTAFPGSGNVNSCPTFDVSCPTRCTKVDANGCLSCSCTGNVAKFGSTSTLSPGSGNINSCPTFDVSCPTECTKVDAQGCLTCSCPGSAGKLDISSTVSPGSGKGDICPTFDVSCPARCTKIDPHGCLTCSCSDTDETSTTPSTDRNTFRTSVGPLNPDNSCPMFDTTKCVAACIAIDVHGCLTCKCPATQEPTTRPVTETTTSTVAQTALQPILTPQPQTAGTCQPVRCSPTCNNVLLDVDNCPTCRCHSTMQPVV